MGLKIKHYLGPEISTQMNPTELCMEEQCPVLIIILAIKANSEQRHAKPEATKIPDRQSCLPLSLKQSFSFSRKPTISRRSFFRSLFTLN
mmetsp:Transcript_6912/g.14570  ORF Transcript_6912/g.14570 Transcript_6912/m.14570 type:complete len:90 (+) Transcript_6912:825-1094(+)